MADQTGTMHELRKLCEAVCIVCNVDSNMKISEEVIRALKDFESARAATPIRAMTDDEAAILMYDFVLHREVNLRGTKYVAAGAETFIEVENGASCILMRGFCEVARDVFWKLMNHSCGMNGPVCPCIGPDGKMWVGRMSASDAVASMMWFLADEAEKDDGNQRKPHVIH